MLIAMVLLIVIGFIFLVLYSFCRAAALSDERMQLMLDPEYLVDEEREEAEPDSGDDQTV